MRSFSQEYIKFENLPRPAPDFENMISVFSRRKPARPTLFEFFLNDKLEALLAPGIEEKALCRIHAFHNAGYDFVNFEASGFRFPANPAGHLHTKSLNDGGIIFDRETFDAYNWQDPDDCYDGLIERLAAELPKGMKLGVMGPCGVLENTIALTGYENLCYMLADDPKLAEDIFRNVGERLCRYYEIIADRPAVGFLIANDDWGFKTQTMLSVDDMRKYVFPWHKRIAEIAHNAGKPAMLHSCGQAEKIYDDIIDDLRFDGKHSYEDNIQPVEEAYEMLKGRIAVIGGLDLDFVCRRQPEEIYNRAARLIGQSGCAGYALGTGNSVPHFVPAENYLAMIAAAVHNR
jgi:uroporphyrinogen decarboxylase